MAPPSGPGCSVENEEPFPNLYEMLEVNFQCTERALGTAYHRLAKIFHPDNPQTGDVARFGEIVGAHKTLRNPRTRSEYDAKYRQFFGQEDMPSVVRSDWDLDPGDGADDGEIHAQILRRLYKRRRDHVADPGEGEIILQEILDCSEAQFAFHAWYLKAKGLIEVTEQGTLAITVAGVDHVISHSRNFVRENLRLSSSVPSLD